MNNSQNGLNLQSKQIKFFFFFFFFFLAKEISKQQKILKATRSLKKITLEPAATITLRTELARIICKNVQKYCSMLYTQCSRDIQGEIKNETTFSFFKQKFSRKTVEFSDQVTLFSSLFSF